MPRPSGPAVGVQVVACTDHSGCYRWIIASTDGRIVEQSRFAYASASGARLVADLRVRAVYARA